MTSPEGKAAIEKKDVAAIAVVGTFQCTMSLTTNRNLVITGHIYSDDTPKQLNERIDHYQDALDRQFIKCDLVNKEAQREATIAQLEDHIEQLELLRAMQGAKGEGVKPRLTAQQLEILKRGDENTRGAKLQIARLDKMIAAAKKKLAA